MKSAILILCLIIASTALADPANIALPDLTGDYDSGFMDPNDAPRVRLNAFTIQPEVISIQSLRVVMSGSNENGSVICERDIGGGQVVRDTMSVVTQMRLVLTAPTLEGDCFFGIVNLLAPTFTDQFGWVTSCDIGNPLDPNLLLNTTVQAELECNFSPSCGPWIDALATLTDVHLILDAQIVAVDLTAWGAIKALYR